MASLMEYFMGKGGQPTMADLLREPGGADWLKALYGTGMMADRPTAGGAPDQVMGGGQSLRIQDLEKFLGQDPYIYGYPSPPVEDNRDVVLRGPHPAFANLMPPGFFGAYNQGVPNDFARAYALDRQRRDEQIIGQQLLSGDPNWSALLRSGAGGM